MVKNVKVTGTKKENKILAWAKKHKKGLLITAGAIAGVVTVGAVGHAAYEFGRKQTQTVPMIELTGDILEKIRNDHAEFETDKVPGYLGGESYMLIPTEAIGLSGYHNPVVTIDVTGFSVKELSEHTNGGKILDDAIMECMKFDDADPVLMIHSIVD